MEKIDRGYGPLDNHMYMYDLGWLVKTVLGFQEELDTAIDLKTIHYADPIQWDITTQYSPNTVVVDPKTGTAYMSKVPVPPGIQLDNTDYWVVIFNYQRIYDKIMSGVAFNDKENAEASKDINKYDFVWYGGDLYQAQRDIPQGSKYVPGVNIVATTIADALANYYGRDHVAQVINDTLTASETQTIGAKNRVITVTGDQTITAGDITETSANRTIKTTADYHIDVDGVTTVNRGGAVTESYGSSLDVGVTGTYTAEYFGTVTERYESKKNVTAKDINIIFPEKQINLRNLYNVISADEYGLSETAEDNSSIINILLENYGGKRTILIPDGEYKFASEIRITKPDTFFICQGKIISTAPVAVSVESSNNYIFINAIHGNKNTGIQYGNDSMINTWGNSVFHIMQIDFCDTGILLYSNNGYGIQHNIFNLNRIDHFKTGILLKCGNTGGNWVNENNFYDGWCFGYEGNNGTETAVKFISGSQQTDPFNGNRFINMSGEGCHTLFDLDKCERNTFENFRSIEQSGTELIKCFQNCQDNVFRSDNAQLDIKSIADRGNNNIYNINFYNEGKAFCKSATVNFNTLIPFDSSPIYTNSSFYFDKDGAIPASSPLSHLTIINRGSTKITVVLPLCVNYPETKGTPWILEIGELTSPVDIILYGGQKFASSENKDGLIRYQLKAYYRYIISTSSVAQFLATPLNPVT